MVGSLLFRVAYYIMYEWKTLEPAKAKEIIAAVKSSAEAGLFSEDSSECRTAALSFYRNNQIYRLTNYQTLPPFSLDYIGDGLRFHYLDGSAQTIYTINDTGALNLNHDNILDYIRFYFQYVQAEDSEIRALLTPHDHQGLNSMNKEHFEEFGRHFRAPNIDYDHEQHLYVVKLTLDNEGALVYGTINVTPAGRLTIADQHLLMQEALPPALSSQGETTL